MRTYMRDAAILFNTWDMHNRSIEQLIENKSPIEARAISDGLQKHLMDTYHSLKYEMKNPKFVNAFKKNHNSDMNIDIIFSVASLENFLGHLNEYHVQAVENQKEINNQFQDLYNSVTIHTTHFPNVGSFVYNIGDVEVFKGFRIAEDFGLEAISSTEDSQALLPKNILRVTCDTSFEPNNIMQVVSNIYINAYVETNSKFGEPFYRA